MARTLMAPKPCKYPKIPKFSALLASLRARPDISPEACSLENFGIFEIFGYLPGFGGTGLQKHCKYPKILKNPNLMAPETCTEPKILKTLKFSTLLASVNARPDTSPEAYSLKNFRIFGIFGHVHGFGTFSFGNF